MFFLIHNPVAGRGRVPDALQRVTRFFAETGIPVRVLTTEGPGHATRLVEQLPGNASVLALGGDGTVHQVAAACAGTPRTLGVLPVGSGDDFAFSLGISRYDLEAALEIVARGRVRKVDTGLANGLRFVNTIGMGFDADVAQRVTLAPSFLRGSNAYLYSVVATLARLRNIPVRVEVDGALVHSGPALLVSAQNGPRTGGGFLFSPDAKNDDGLLDVVIAAGFSRLGTVGVLPRVLRGTHLTHPRVRLVRGRCVLLRWAEPRPAHMEGELLPPSNHYDIRIEPKSLRVFA